MAQRTTTTLVKELLSTGGDYDTANNPSLQPFIDKATAMVDRVATCATNKGTTLTTAELELVERWLSAHYYTKADPTYTSRSTAGASGQFARNPECPEPYKDGAIDSDVSGCLNALLSRQRAGLAWLGLPPSGQTPYDQRD